VLPNAAEVDQRAIFLVCPPTDRIACGQKRSTLAPLESTTPLHLGARDSGGRGTLRAPRSCPMRVAGFRGQLLETGKSPAQAYHSTAIGSSRSCTCPALTSNESSVRPELGSDGTLIPRARPRASYSVHGPRGVYGTDRRTSSRRSSRTLRSEEDADTSHDAG
jgi:hypothetical protein